MDDEYEPPPGFRRLRVWQSSFLLADSCCDLADLMPQEQRYEMARQLRRASVSVPTNIAEGNGRLSDGEYVHHLKIARGSLKEVETLLLLARKRRYLQPENVKPVLKDAEQTGRQLHRLIKAIERRRNSGKEQG